MTGRGAASAARGAGLALVTLALLPPDPRWQRTNHRGRTVSLASGPALALAAGLTGGSAAAVVAGLVSGAVGAYDDAVGGRPGQRSAKGFRGHVTALRRGQVTAGAVKVGGVGAAGLAAALLLGQRRPADLVVTAGVVAGSANLVNLLDLRPGRALKAGALAAAALRAPGPAAAALVLLPGDLGERTMLGDTGANALGAVLGVALAERLGTGPRRGALALLVALTAASEVVSFSRVIDAVPPLARLDRLGRTP